MTLNQLLKNKIFITFLVLGMLEPRCVGELAGYQGGIWSTLHHYNIWLLYISLIVIIGIVLISVRKISWIAIAVIIFQVYYVSTDINNNLAYMGDLIRAFEAIGLVLIIEIYCRKGIQKQLLEVMSFWLGLYIIINFMSIIIYPTGMYIDSRGWAQNYFFGYKNSHIYVYLPYLVFSALRDALKFGKLKLRFYVMVGIITVSCFLSGSSTSALVLLLIAILVVFAHGVTFPKWLNAATGMIASAILSIAIIGFNFQERFSGIIQWLFQKDATFTNRVSIWTASLSDIARNPIWGNGNGSVSIALYWDVTQCHNKFLDILFVGGAIMMAIFVWLTYLACSRLIKETGNVSANIITFVMFGYAILFLMESRRPDILIFAVYALAFHIKYFNAQIADVKIKHLLKK